MPHNFNMGSKMSCTNKKKSFDVYPLLDDEDCCDDSRCGEFFWPGGFGMCRTELDLGINYVFTSTTGTEDVVIK